MKDIIIRQEILKIIEEKVMDCLELVKRGEDFLKTTLIPGRNANLYRYL